MKQFKNVAIFMGLMTSGFFMSMAFAQDSTHPNPRDTQQNTNQTQSRGMNNQTVPSTSDRDVNAPTDRSNNARTSQSTNSQNTDDAQTNDSYDKEAY